MLHAAFLDVWALHTATLRACVRRSTQLLLVVHFRAALCCSIVVLFCLAAVRRGVAQRHTPTLSAPLLRSVAQELMSIFIGACTAVCSVVVGEAALAALLKGVCGCATCADAERRVRDNAALGLAAVVRPAVARPSRPPVRAAMWFLGFTERADVAVTTLRTGLYGLVVALSHFLFGCDTAGHTIITCGVATIKGKHQLQGGNHGNHLMRKYGGGLYSVWVNVFGTVRGKEGGKEKDRGRSSAPCRAHTVRQHGARECASSTSSQRSYFQKKIFKKKSVFTPH